jgi:predicted GIY-YIG superfamily endonuclease
MFKIYKITNTVNDKVYVGYTSLTLDQRFKRHLTSSNQNKTKFHRAINLHGKDKFQIFLLGEAASLEEAKIKEIEGVTQYDSYVHGYNSTRGGDYLPADISLSALSEKSQIKRIESYKKWLSTPDGIRFKENKREMFKKLKPHLHVTPDGLIRAAKKYQKWLTTSGGVERRKQSAENMRRIQPLRHNGYYEFINPSGETIRVEGNILAFCKENKLSFFSFYYAFTHKTFYNKKGKNAGWTILTWNKKPLLDSTE